MLVQGGSRKQSFIDFADAKHRRANNINEGHQSTTKPNAVHSGSSATSMCAHLRDNETNCPRYNNHTWFGLGQFAPSKVACNMLEQLRAEQTTAERPQDSLFLFRTFVYDGTTERLCGLHWSSLSSLSCTDVSRIQVFCWDPTISSNTNTLAHLLYLLPLLTLQAPSTYLVVREVQRTRDGSIIWRNKLKAKKFES